MARENQNLQIGLIVFVMLAIVFAVLTFVFSKEYNKQKTVAEEKVAEAGEGQYGVAAGRSGKHATEDDRGLSGHGDAADD